MDLTCGLADKLRKLVLDPIWKQLLYPIYYHRNTEQLNQGLEDLTDKRISTLDRIDEARNNVEQIKLEVLHWLVKVDEMSERAQQFREEASQTETECSITSFPNPWLRYKLSKRAEAMARQVANICAKANFDRVSYPLLPKKGTVPEQDIRPTQASSSNTEELPPQQDHDAANDAISSAPNLCQQEICDQPIGDGGSPSVHVASDGANRYLVAVNEESAASAPISICESTNFSTWKRGKRIGAGGFGAVYVLHDRKNRRSCAVKQLIDIPDTRSIESLRKEIDILSKFEHPNIVKYYGHEEVGSNIHLFMEYIEPGSLKQYISKRGVLDETLIRKITSQILSGLVYLRSERVVHRDLKPDNILVDFGDIVKLVDFGLAKKLAESMGKHSVLGTPYYVAPEILENKEYERSCDASTADIWSLGCVIIEMFSGKHPWPGFEPVQVFFKVCHEKQHPPIPEELCSEGQDFLRRCFERIPAKRPSAAELLHHPFVKAQTC